ncbi:MAG: glutathione S-transferase family protein [Alphaproteobacteria bacterium]
MYHLYLAATANGRRPAVMLEECGIPYTAHKIDLAKGEQRKPEYLALNPQGTVPVLVEEEGGKKTALGQSGAILLHLAEKTGKFLPKEPAARATALQWFMMAQTDAAPTSSAIFFASSTLPDKSPANTQFFEGRFVNMMKVFDQRLGQSAYLAGAEPTIADFALITVAAGRQELIDKTPGLDSLKKWLAKMKARPGVAKALQL